jgi:hypothetical protein
MYTLEVHTEPVTLCTVEERYTEHDYCITLS